MKRAKRLTPWVDFSSHQYPESGLLAGLVGAFTPKSPFEVPKKTPHIYTIIRHKSVDVRKRQVAILARSPQEMSLN